MLEYNYKTKRIKGKVKKGGFDQYLDIDFCFDRIDKANRPTEESLKFQQVMLYVMCGGGMLGRFAMCQPADFYIDLRVGRLPYPHRDIEKAIEVLKALADYLKKDPHNLPEPKFFGSWVF